MNCKPGDLAFIVGGLCNPSPNLGRIVEVKRLDLMWSEIEGCPVWQVDARNPLLCADILGRDVFVTEASMKDSWLRPISGVPVDDEMPVATNVLEAVKLAWGIEARVLS